MSRAAAVALVLAVLAARGPRGRPLSTVVGVGAGAGPHRRRGRRDRVSRPARAWWGRARGRGGPDLGVLVVEVAARLRAGVEPQRAWEGALGRPLPPGGPTVDDLAAAPGDRGPAATVVAAGRLAADLGAPLAPILDAVAAQLATDAEAESERRAALAGPRATGRVLTGLPVLGVLLGIAVGADPLGVLLDGAVGSAALVAGLALVVAGRTWTARLAGRAAAAGRAP